MCYCKHSAILKLSTLIVYKVANLIFTRLKYKLDFCEEIKFAKLIEAIALSYNTFACINLQIIIPRFYGLQVNHLKNKLNISFVQLATDDLVHSLLEFQSKASGHD